MRQVQTDFIDAVTFRYDDETRRNLIKTFSRKETLLDADLLEEHLVNQPLLGCIILLLAFFALFSLIFAIVFVACRALGNCGAKRYQAHPTSGRRYFFHVGIFIISWIAMTVSASFFIQSGAAIWNPKIPIDLFDLDHTVIKRNASVDDQLASRVRARRSVQETVTKRPISVFDLFADGDYLGDFEVEKTEAPITTPAAFVTATFPEENPIPIARTNKTIIRTTDKNIARYRTRQQDKDEGGQASSAENEDIPPAVDRLPIRPITEESSTTRKPTTSTTVASTSKHFEIPVRPRAELDYGKQFEQGAPFVSNLWNGPRLTQAAAEMPHIRQSKLQIQPIVPDNERGGWTTTPVDNDIEEEVEVDSEEASGEVKSPVEGNGKHEIPVPSPSFPASTPTAPPTIPEEEPVTAVPHAPVHQEKESIRVTPEEEILSNEQQDSEPVVEEKADVITGDNMPTGHFPQFNAQLEKSMEVVSSSETNGTSKESTPETTTITEEARTSMATTVENLNTTTATISTSTTLPPEPAATEDGSVESLEETSELPDEKEEDLVLSGAETSEITITAASTITSPPTPATEPTPPPTEFATTMETTVITRESTTTTTTAPVTSTEEITTKMTVETSTEDKEHIEMVTIPVTEGSSTITEGRKPLPIATEENVDDRPVVFVPIAKSEKEEEWKPVTDNPKTAATLAIFPSVPLSPEISHGKVEQLATPLLYPYRLLHTVAVIWIARLTLIIVGLIMIVVTLPSLALVLMGSFFYKSTQHPIDRKRTSDQIGQLVVILATFLLFALPLLLFFVQVTLAYHHLHNAICPSLQLKYQQDLGIIGPISSLTLESRDIVLRNVVNRDNCQTSEAPVETMWLSCLCFAIFSIPLLVSLFKLSKYYLRMKTEYYWSLNDNYGTIYAKREPSSPGQDIYGNIYGTVNPRRPTSRPPPVPSTQSETVSYADGPVYTDGPIYGVYQAYGRL